MITICCDCQRTQEITGWKKEKARPAERISHGFCPECYLKMLARIQWHFSRGKPYPQSCGAPRLT